MSIAQAFAQGWSISAQGLVRAHSIDPHPSLYYTHGCPQQPKHHQVLPMLAHQTPKPWLQQRPLLLCRLYKAKHAVFVTARILVVDLLTSRITPAQISGAEIWADMQDSVQSQSQICCANPAAQGGMHMSLPCAAVQNLPTLLYTCLHKFPVYVSCLSQKVVFSDNNSAHVPTLPLPGKKFKCWLVLPSHRKPLNL